VCPKYRFLFWGAWVKKEDANQGQRVCKPYKKKACTGAERSRRLGGADHSEGLVEKNSSPNAKKTAGTKKAKLYRAKLTWMISAGWVRSRE